MPGQRYADEDRCHAQREEHVPFGQARDDCRERTPPESAARDLPGAYQGKAEESHEWRAERLFRDITLTSAQQAKVDSIQMRYREQMPSFTRGSPPDSATRERVRGLFRHELDDIRGVLTADQQKVFDKNLADMRARRSGGP